MSSKIQPIVSTNLKSAVYDETGQELIVEFKTGKRHRYFDVSPSLYADFEKTFDGKNGSAGSFFAKQIRFLANEPIEE